ncbi:hypothetical protein QO003_001746 [Arthrobacter silviterrae]|nr:hypothetical protein [Arthrobacter silviterrae]
MSRRPRGQPKRSVCHDFDSSPPAQVPLRISARRTTMSHSGSASVSTTTLKMFVPSSSIGTRPWTVRKGGSCGVELAKAFRPREDSSQKNRHLTHPTGTGTRMSRTRLAPPRMHAYGDHVAAAHSEAKPQARTLSTRMPSPSIRHGDDGPVFGQTDQSRGRILTRLHHLIQGSYFLTWKECFDTAIPTAPHISDSPSTAKNPAVGLDA